MILDDTVPTPGATPGPPQQPLVGLSGQRFGAYEIIEEIARGGQGAVLRARHMELGTIVALKVLLSPEPQAVRRFQEEAQILARLRHPNLPAVTDLGAVSGRPYLAMEFISGKDLKSHVQERGLPSPEWTVEVLRSVALTLQYCHEQGIVHRDLKPANILIEESEGRPVLVDFGLVKRDRRQFQLPAASDSISKATGAAASLTAGAEEDLTQVGQVMGTPAYMAPEQADPTYGEIGPRTDVYALGATLHFLLSGRPPYEAKTVYTVIAKLLKNSPAPNPAEREPHAHPALAALCQRTLSKSPDARPPTAMAFADALTEALRARERAARRALSSLALVLVGLAIGAGAVASQARRPKPWAEALLHLRGDRALRADEVASLDEEGSADWRRWRPLALAQSALLADAAVPPELLKALPATQQGDLLRFEARLRDLQRFADPPPKQEAALTATDCIRLLEAGARAVLPWRSESPSDRWARLAKELEARAFVGEAAKAWVWSAHFASQSGHAEEADAWISRAFALDPLEAAVNGDPVAEFLLSSAASALREAVTASKRSGLESTDALARLEREVRAARVKLERFRMIRPRAAIPAETLANLRSLGWSTVAALRLAAMDGSLIPAERAEIEAVLDLPLTPEELETLTVGDPRTWPPRWGPERGLLSRVRGQPDFRRVRITQEWLLWRPDHAGLWASLAHELQWNSQPRASEYAYRIALKYERRAPGLELRLGHALFEQRDYPEALVHYREAVEIQRTLYSAHALARTLIIVGKPAEAISVLDTIAKQAERNAHCWMTRGDAYAALGDLEQAEACRARARELR